MEYTKATSSKVSPSKSSFKIPGTLSEYTVQSYGIDDAIIFSIHFYGKLIGELGLLYSDLIKLDWKKFKSYLFQNLFSMSCEEEICITYNDEEGDKLPIESEEEYQEALKIAKRKAMSSEKLVLEVSKNGGLPRVFSLVSSGLKRVKSLPRDAAHSDRFYLHLAGKKHSEKLKKVVSTKRHRDAKVCTECRPSPDSVQHRLVPQGATLDQNLLSVPSHGAHKLMEREENVEETPPLWFTTYMQKFTKDITQEITRNVVEELKQVVKDSSSAGYTERTREGDHAERKMTVPNCSSNEDFCQKRSTSPVQKIEVQSWLNSTFPNSDSKCAAPFDDILMADRGHKKKKHEAKCCCRDLHSCAKKTLNKTLDHNKLKKVLERQVLNPTPRQLFKTKTAVNVINISKKRLDGTKVKNIIDSITSEFDGTVGLGYNAEFLTDVTYPDGTVVKPGERFKKTWKVKNNGGLPWDEKTFLRKWSTVTFRGVPAKWKLIPEYKKVFCPCLMPGETGTVSVTFMAPMKPGWYATHWRFCHKNTVFGNQMWCAVQVSKPDSDSAVSGAPSLNSGLLLSNVKDQEEEPTVEGFLLTDDSTSHGTASTTADVEHCHDALGTVINKDHLHASSAATSETGPGPRTASQCEAEGMSVPTGTSPRPSFDAGLNAGEAGVELRVEYDNFDAHSLVTAMSTDMSSDNNLSQEEILEEEQQTMIKNNRDPESRGSSSGRSSFMADAVLVEDDRIDSVETRSEMVATDELPCRPVPLGPNSDCEAVLETEESCESVITFSDDDELSDSDFCVLKNIPECFNFNHDLIDVKKTSKEAFSGTFHDFESGVIDATGEEVLTSDPADKRCSGMVKDVPEAKSVACDVASLPSLERMVRDHFSIDS